MQLLLIIDLNFLQRNFTKKFSKILPKSLKYTGLSTTRCPPCNNKEIDSLFLDEKMIKMIEIYTNLYQ